MPISETFGLEFKFGGNSEFLARLEALMRRVDGAFESVSGSVDGMKDDLGELNAKADDTIGAFREMDDSVSRMSKSFDGLGDKVGKAVKGFLGFQAVRKVMDFGMGAIDDFSVGQRRENQLRNVMGNMGNGDRVPEIMGLVDEMSGRTVYDRTSLIAGAGELATYVSGGESLKKMMGLLSDYAAGMTGGGQVAPEQMEMFATGLGMAYGGQGYESLRKKGFDVDGLKLLDALGESGGVETAAIRKKFGAVDPELLNAIRDAGGITESMRVDALKEALSTWDGLAESVAGLDSSSLVRLENRIADLRGELGERLAPVLNRLVAGMEAHLPEIERMMDSVGDVFEAIVDFLARNVGTFAGVAKAVGTLVSSVAKFPTAGLAMYSALKMLQGGTSGAFAGFSRLDKSILKATASVAQFSKAGALLAGGGGVLAGMAADVGSDKGGSENALGVLGSMANGAMIGASQFGLMGAAIGAATAAVFSLVGAISAFFDEVDERRERDEKQKTQSKSHEALNKSWNRYKKAKAAYDADPTRENEEELRRAIGSHVSTVETAKNMGVGVAGYMDLVAEAERRSAGKEAKAAKANNLYMNFGDTNYTQKVELSADIDKVGLALNMSMRKFIESQVRLDRAGAIVTEVG